MNTAPNIYQIGLTDINGRETNLSEYCGKVLFVVNVASKCGFTPHYEGLQELHERYHEKGLVVCGFPSNDFFGEQNQEDEIRRFCSFNYGVTFPLFTKKLQCFSEIHASPKLLSKGTDSLISSQTFFLL